MIVSFIISDTPFSCGVPGTVFSLRIPWYEQQSSNSLLHYSPPLFDLRHFNIFLVSFSTKAFHFVKVSKTYDLCQMQLTQVFLVASPIKVT
jgi:hypothetical protein